MELPTMLVRVKASGHMCRINVADFNSEVHEEPATAKAETATKGTKAASDSTDNAEDAGKRAKGKN